MYVTRREGTQEQDKAGNGEECTKKIEANVKSGPFALVGFRSILARF